MWNSCVKRREAVTRIWRWASRMPISSAGNHVHVSAAEIVEKDTHQIIVIGIAAILSGWKNLSAVSGAAGDDSGGA